MASINNIPVPTPLPLPQPGNLSLISSRNATGAIPRQPKVSIHAANQNLFSGMSSLATQNALAQIIENTKTTFQAGRQIASSASTQAQADKTTGKGILEGMRSFTKTIDNLTNLISNHAQTIGYAKSKQQDLTPEQLGSIAQNYAYLSVRDALIDGVKSSAKQTPPALEDRSTLDLVLDNLGFTSDKMSVNPAGQSIQTQPGGITGSMIETGTGLAASASSSSKLLGLVGAAYSGYQVFANWGKSDPVSGAISGFTAGAYLGGATFGPVGAAVGGIIGGLVGIASSFFGASGKSKDQLGRDQVRQLLQSNGIISENWELSLANRARYDIGKDGKFKLTNTDGSTTRRAFEVDFSNPLAAETVGMVQPLAMLITGGNQKLANDFTGYFTNAALSNAKNLEDARQNAVAILQSMKLSPEQTAQGIAEMVKQGIITEVVGKAYLNGIASLITPVKQEKINVTNESKKAPAKPKKAA